MNINGKEIATREFKLDAMGVSVKSLYGRAKVRVYGNTGVYSLLSYGTEVAAGMMETDNRPAEMFRIYDSRFDFMFGGWSATTAKHLASFAAFLGCSYGGKKAWTDKQYTTIADVLGYVENGGNETIAA